jgi:hypothetical protein
VGIQGSKVLFSEGVSVGSITTVTVNVGVSVGVSSTLGTLEGVRVGQLLTTPDLGPEQPGVWVTVGIGVRVGAAGLGVTNSGGNGVVGQPLVIAVAVFDHSESASFPVAFTRKV